LRHLDEDAALRILDEALPFKSGSPAWAWTPPSKATAEKFSRVFKRAREAA